MWIARPLACLLVFAATAPLVAANVLTVGPAGSGAQFSEIQAAVDAAVPGDVLLVRPGTYAPIVVAKPLRILGDGSGIVRIGGPRVGVSVHDVGAGEEFVLSGAEIIPGTVGQEDPTVLLENCPGTLVLQDVTLPSFTSFAIGVRVESCARVLLLDSEIFGGVPGETPSTQRGAVLAQDSELWVVNSAISGEAYNVGYQAGAAHGVELVGSTLRVWRSQIFGGSIGGTTMKSGGNGGTGIKASDSRVELFGGPESLVTGGMGTLETLSPFSFPGGPGVDLLLGSSARIQSLDFVNGGFDGNGLVQSPDVRVDGSSSFALDPRSVPSLASNLQQVARGGTFELTLLGNPGGRQVLWLSLRTGPTKTYPGVDGLGMLDASSLFRLTSVVLPPSGSFVRSLQVPNIPALLGATLFFQTVEGFGGHFAIGHPVLVTITG